MRTVSRKSHRGRRERAHWINDQFVCDCGSRHFTVFREKVARKVHTRWASRRRRAAVCENGHKTRIGFPSKPRHK